MGNAVREALAIAIQMGQPVLLWGGPGEGKSAVVEQIARQLGRPCEVVIGSVREASDFAGLPMRTGDSVSFVPPRWAGRCVEHPDSVVFFDELTTAQPSVQAAMLRVVLEREVGDLSLPASVSIVAAANPPETSAGGDDLSAPLANRFCHLEWEADVTEWASGMLRGWDPVPLPLLPTERRTHELRWRALVAAFIRARPSLLRQVPSTVMSQGRAWPSPRTWDMVHRVAAAADAAASPKKVRALLVEGLVGVGAGIEFLRYAEEVDLPDPEAVLVDPSLLNVNPRADLLLACLSSVMTAVSMDCSRDRWDAAWEVLASVCDRGRADIAALAATELIDLRQPDWATPRSVAAFLPILREAGLL